ALALEANPSWSSKQLYDAVRKTASASSKPNNEIGFGIPNALKAMTYDPSGSSNPFVKNILSYPNPASGTVFMSFQSQVTSTFSIKIYNSIGQFVIAVSENEPVSANQIVTKKWNGKNFNGNEVSSGVYFYRISLGGKSTTEKILILK
ncbi:T9SS type A sorting domain-containing protein, partial [bacterium]|nr:T9SS type A sorting domain-containing protein [bacterium]